MPNAYYLASILHTMKTKLILLPFAILTFCFQSCKQCTECTKFPGEPLKLCKKDYASDDSYNAAYKHAIADGYKCD
jgi:hypothetical protein